MLLQSSSWIEKTFSHHPSTVLTLLMNQRLLLTPNPNHTILFFAWKRRQKRRKEANVKVIVWRERRRFGSSHPRSNNQGTLHRGQPIATHSYAHSMRLVPAGETGPADKKTSPPSGTTNCNS